ncbi:type I polyketide synthase, partial [Streptomyces lydicus]|uniref:type I polyketide synthase n=1 Tax=Streptomyces lydicus TaxID=47763 RepID=UPI0037AE3095
MSIVPGGITESGPISEGAIAVVGLACRLPQAPDPQAFWQLLKEGRSAVGEVPHDRWDADTLTGPARHGAFLDRVDGFDAAFFGISPREAAMMDPQQRLVLELAWEALEDAGILPERVRGTRTGVFFGAMWDDYATLLHRRGLSAVTQHSVTGLHRSIIANRVSYALGLRGPSLTVDTAQSSGLTAVHLACESLRSGASEIALAGGVNLNIVPESAFGAEKFGGLSPDGRCYTFDERANGYVRGEGGGVVLLKPLARALADGDPVYCVIRGSAMNNDGATDGLTVPNPQAQQDVLRLAYEAAGVGPAQVQYVELHGTGTKVGDPVEASALGAVLGTADGRERPVAVGSAKTNVGHLEGAAGIVGLLKVALSLRNGQLPASLNYAQPNPRIALDEWNLRVQRSLTDWPAAGAGALPLAGVSSFGMGGTNCHVVLEGAPEGVRAGDDGEPGGPASAEAAGPLPWVLSGTDSAALRAQAERLRSFVAARPETPPADVALTLATSRTAFAHRAVVLGQDMDALLNNLTAVSNGQASPGVVEGCVSGGSGRVGFLFSGQGSQRVGMGRVLYGAFPVFAAAVDEVCGAFDGVLGGSLREVMFAEGVGAEGVLERTEFAQPALFAVEVGLFRLVESWGVRADFVAGHSVGELAAAYVAGVWSLADAVRVVAARGRLMQALPGGGAMVSLVASEGEVAPLVAGRAGEVGLAAVNGPSSVVVSGAEGAVGEIAAHFEALGRRVRRLRVSHAFHSPLMDPMLEEFGGVVRSVEFSRPRLGMVAGEGVCDPEFWVRHVRDAVRFADQISWLENAGVSTFVEMGPGGVLTALTRECVTRPDALLVPMLRKGFAEDRAVAKALAELHVRGVRVNWGAFLEGNGHRGRRTTLPSYAFQRERHWLPDLEKSANVEKTPDLEKAPDLKSAPQSERAEESPKAQDTGKVPDAGKVPDTEKAPCVERQELSLAERVAAAPREDAERLLREVVRVQVAVVLGHDSADTVKMESRFKELGCDSLMAVELCSRLGDATGQRLPASLTFDHPTPNAVVSHLLAEIRRGQDPEPVSETAPGDTVVTQVSVGSEADPAEDDPIVIVSMACRFPGGIASPEDLWRLVAEGGDAISVFPADRGWDVEALYDADPEHSGTSYVREGGFLHEAAEFDPAFFGISPREALAMDPQQRLLLETSWEAFERAGIVPRSLRGSRTGVFVGATAQDYGPRLHEAADGAEGYALTGTTASVLSGRLSYTFGLEGPAVTVDTACSSSLVALHLAVRALRQGECTLALASGATVMSHPGMFVEFSRQRGLAVDGRCKAFAAGADGTGWAEGVGVLVLERLSDARRNGHEVLAVVRGTAVNQDGASNGLTAPNGPSQQRVIRQALADARLSPSEVDAVEAHGTGTRLGDPIEAQALLATYGQGRAEGRPLWLGSLKSNVGHTQAAAGVGGVIKMVMALRQGVLPRTLHVDAPSPHVDWSAGAVELLTEAREWPSEAGRVRRAGVSSFGVSGTNAHAIIEQAPAAEAEELPAVDEPGASASVVVPWVVSGRGVEALRAQAGRLRSFVEARPELGPVEVGRSLAVSRSAFERRAVVLGADRGALLDALGALSAGREAAGVVEGSVREVGRTVLVFPGQGSQWVGMGAELIASSPVFAESMRRCGEALAPFVDWDLLEVVSEGRGLGRADVVQPVTWAVMVSLAELWRSVGVVPDAVVGHSQGEIAAAVVAGGLSLEDGARVVALRSQVIGRELAGRGGMASIALPEAEVRQRIGDVPELGVAAVNGPSSTVVSGDAGAVEAFVVACEADGVRARRIAVDYASHSAHVEAIEQELLTVLKDVRPQAGSVPFYSTVENTFLDTEALDAAYWYRNLRHQVQFEAGIRALAAEGFTTFVESSAHPVLTVGIQETLDDTDTEAVVTGSLRREEGGLERFLTSAAELYVAGVPVNWSPFLAGAGVRRLPTYAFQRERFWLEAPVPTAGEATAVDTRFWAAVEAEDWEALRGELALEGDAPLSAVLPALASWRREQQQTSAVDSWRYRVVWKPVAVEGSVPVVAGRWLVVVPAGFEGDVAVVGVTAALEERGVEVRRVVVEEAGADRSEVADQLRAVVADAVSG